MTYVEAEAVHVHVHTGMDAGMMNTRDQLRGIIRSRYLNLVVCKLIGGRVSHLHKVHKYWYLEIGMLINKRYMTDGRKVGDKDKLHASEWVMES